MINRQRFVVKKLKRPKNLHYLLIFLSLFTCTSCSTLRNIFKNRDPWNGRYLHYSGRYELLFKHFMDEATEVNLFEIPRKEGERPRLSVFAYINKNKAVFKAPHESNCRVEFLVVDNGIMLSDFCNGTGEDEGLYKATE